MIASRNLELIPTWQKQQNLIEQRIRDLAGTSDRLEILEAGCGQNWNTNLEGVKYSITGVDIDAVALEIRKRLFNDLDKSIEGDLRSVYFEDRSFNVIYNAYVLEHVDGAEVVLRNFVRWLKPGGIIILKIPDPNSVKGLFTRLTPHWFHIWYFRHILNKTTAGYPGHAPYRTFFDRIVSRRGIRKFCAESDLTIIDEYGIGLKSVNQGIKERGVSVFSQFVQILSLGLLSARHSNLLYVLKLKQTPKSNLDSACAARED